MRVTRAMIQAAQRAEFDFYQRRRQLSADRFVPTDEAVIRVMLEAVLAAAVPDQNLPAPQRTIVVAQPPRRRR